GIVLPVVQTTERLERSDIRVVEVDDILISIDGAIDVRHLVDVDAGNLPPQLYLRLVVGRLVDVPLVSANQIQPLLEPSIAALEGDIGPFFGRRNLQGLFEPLSRRVGLEKLLF